MVDPTEGPEGARLALKADPLLMPAGADVEIVGIQIAIFLCLVERTHYRFEGLNAAVDVTEMPGAQADDKAGKNEDYSVEVETCMMLQLEALQYYHRRISFLELEDYERAKRDAERNLDLFDFVKEYASDEEDKLAFEQNRPFVIGHRVRASALLKLESDDYDGALSDIEEGIEEIQSLFTEFDLPDLVEDSEEVEFLREWADEIREDRPRSHKQDLRDQLKEAVALEEFEKAAEIRDRIHAVAKAGKNF